jgi:hypothetical protein
MRDMPLFWQTFQGNLDSLRQVTARARSTKVPKETITISKAFPMAQAKTSLPDSNTAHLSQG